MFYFTGWAIAASAHKELQQKGAHHEWFTLPVATWEKALFRMIPSLVLWPLVFFPLVWVGRMLSVILFAIIDPSHHFFLVSLYPKEVGDLVLTYSLGHALFYFGGVYFTSHPVPKTILVTILGFFLLGMWTAGWLWVWTRLKGLSFFGWIEGAVSLSKGFSTGISIFTTLVFWGLSFIRMKEREARGV
ncbi:hypothetical protein [Spirochaeta thermophila]|nr:hypothetical protein [Spirochaeta thermophila]